MEYTRVMQTHGSTIFMRPMRPDEFPSWRARFVSDWAQDLERIEDLTAPGAALEAERRVAADLPHGIATADHYLFVIEEGAARVGVAWLSVNGNRAFLDDLTIEPLARGRGYGEAALGLVESELRGRGLGHLDLHVYADNAAAIGLYTKRGFRTTGIKMRKDL